MECLDLKFYVPSKDYKVSKRFYETLGFKVNWELDELTEFQVGKYRFLLQNFFNEELAKNYMVHLLVDNVDDWFASFKEKISPEFCEITKITTPKMEPWGQRTCYLTDPSGVLWHIAQK